MSAKENTLKEYVRSHELICVTDHIIHQIENSLNMLVANDSLTQVDYDKHIVFEILRLLDNLESDLNSKYNDFLMHDCDDFIMDTSDLCSPPVAYGGKYYLDDIGEIIENEVKRYVELIKSRHSNVFGS